MNELKIGWARRDVSTNKSVNIPGQFHMRISQGILDPVCLAVLVLDNGEDFLAMLSIDIVSVSPLTLRLIRSKLAEKLPEFDASKLIVNATHTHAAPANSSGMANSDQNFPIDPSIKIEPMEKYRDFLAESAADAVVEAWKKRAPGFYAYGYGYAVVSHSRKVWYFDDLSKRPGLGGLPGACVNGHAAMYGQTNDPMFSHYEAGADHFVNMLFTYDAGKRLMGAVINLSCPSQCSEGISMISASFWHETRQMLRAKYGDIDVLPQCAPAGDLSPRILHYKEAQARRFQLKYGKPEAFAEEFARHDIAERITAAFDETIVWASRELRSTAKIKNSVREIRVPSRKITDEEYANEKAIYQELLDEPFKEDGTPLERLMHDSSLAGRRTRSKGILERYEAQKSDPTYPLELHVGAIDDIAFVSSPFELYMDYMHRIQARSPFTQTFNIQLAANAATTRSGGYLATQRGIEGAGYSASRYCNNVSPEGGQMLVEETLADLTRIHESMKE